jgi:hypothetical protein
MAAAWPRQGTYKVSQFEWMVPSSGTIGAYWLVSWHHARRSRNRVDPAGGSGVFFRCSCPAGVERGDMSSGKESLARPCRHVRAVAAAEQADGIPPRPPGKLADPSVFVD